MFATRPVRRLWHLMYPLSQRSPLLQAGRACVAIVDPSGRMAPPTAHADACSPVRPTSSTHNDACSSKSRFQVVDNSKKRRARQSNRPADPGRWADFSAERRLRRMLRCAVDSGNLPDELARGADRVTACLPSPPGPVSCGQDNSKKRIAKTPSVRVVPDRTGRVKIQRQGPAPSATVARVTHAKLEITAEVVRELLRDQHPDLADRPVTPGARGWVNQLWRLGDDLAVRLPWATQSADALLLRPGTWRPAGSCCRPAPSTGFTGPTGPLRTGRTAQTVRTERMPRPGGVPAAWR